MIPATLHHLAASFGFTVQWIAGHGICARLGCSRGLMPLGTDPERATTRLLLIAGENGLGGVA